jgi:hypothetical protein
MSEIGKEATIYGYKEILIGGPMQISAAKDGTDSIVEILQRCLGPVPILDIHYYICGVSLNSLNAILHPSLMYGQWVNWDGQPTTEKPRFYFDAQELGIEVMTGVSNEVTLICKALQSKHPELNFQCVDPIFDFLLRVYNDQIKDKTNLYTAVRSNKAYEEIMHPLVETTDGRFLPDFTSRYLTEDIPFGMVPLKGMAKLLEVSTPTMDKVIAWAQELLGKEYLVNGALEGKDLHETSCPQSCGANFAYQLFGSQ